MWKQVEYALTGGYDRHRAALLEKMKHAGMAVEYSDATVVVRSGLLGD